MKNPKTMKPVMLFLAAALAGLAGAYAQTVSLTGTVTDASGAKLKGAKVVLLAGGDSVYTDANGVYKFDVATSLEAKALAPENAPAVEGGSVRFGIRGGAQRVRISLFSLSGRLANELSDARLADGDYRVNPFRAGMTAGNYLVRVQIGAVRRTLTVPYVAGLSESQPAFQKTGGAGASAAALRKTSAVVDTINVIAIGFERGERTVESLSGTQDFKLNAITKLTKILYKTGTLNAAEKSACILDVHKPSKGAKWPVVVYYHGGGMTGGDYNENFSGSYANFGQKFLDAGYMMVSVSYRLIGQGTWPDYINDAAAAAVWVRKNIEPYGGDPNSVFISGFSAGAYLTHMLAIDSTYLAAQGSNQHKFAGYISCSGQTKQHGNIAADLHVSDIMAQKPYAMPMGHLHKTTVPWEIFVGGNEGQTITDNKDLYNGLIAKGSTDLYFDIIPNQPHTVGDMGAATSVRRDKFFAFIEKYKAK